MITTEAIPGLGLSTSEGSVTPALTSAGNFFTYLMFTATSLGSKQPWGFPQTNREPFPPWMLGEKYS